MKMDYYADNNANLNEEYLREMEKNAQLFEQKMQKLNRFQFNETNDNISLQPTNQHNQMQMQSQYSNPNNFTFKATSLDNQQQPFNQQGSNTKLIEQLQNEISYKDTQIKELQAELSLVQKNSHNEDEFNKELELMQNDLDLKYKENAALKEENENLKLKIDNLKIENQNIKSSKEKQINLSENLQIELTQTQEELAMLRKKIADLDLQNKKINKDYADLNKNYSLARKEIASLKSLIDEEKAKNYNLNSDLTNAKKSLQKALVNDNNISQTIPNKPTLMQYEYSTAPIQTPTTSNKIGLRTAYKSNSKNAFNELGYVDSNVNNAYEGINYFPCEQKYKENKNEVAMLEAELGARLKEMKLIEGELLKLPDRPRTLNEIKTKKEKNERLCQLEESVSKIRFRLRELNK
jgi:hypothetical protein